MVCIVVSTLEKQTFYIVALQSSVDILSIFHTLQKLCLHLWDGDGELMEPGFLQTSCRLQMCLHHQVDSTEGLWLWETFLLCMLDWPQNAVIWGVLCQKLQEKRFRTSVWTSHCPSGFQTHTTSCHKEWPSIIGLQQSPTGSFKLIGPSKELIHCSNLFQPSVFSMSRSKWGVNGNAQMHHQGLCTSCDALCVSTALGKNNLVNSLCPSHECLWSGASQWDTYSQEEDAPPLPAWWSTPPDTEAPPQLTTQNPVSQGHRSWREVWHWWAWSMDWLTVEHHKKYGALEMLQI